MANRLHYAPLDSSFTVCGRDCFHSPTGVDGLPNVTEDPELPTCLSCINEIRRRAKKVNTR